VDSSTPTLNHTRVSQTISPGDRRVPHERPPQAGQRVDSSVIWRAGWMPAGRSSRRSGGWISKISLNRYRSTLRCGRQSGQSASPRWPQLGRVSAVLAGGWGRSGTQALVVTTGRESARSCDLRRCPRACAAHPLRETARSPARAALYLEGAAAGLAAAGFLGECRRDLGGGSLALHPAGPPEEVLVRPRPRPTWPRDPSLRTKPPPTSRR
jgi:hypothetical protein